MSSGIRTWAEALGPNPLREATSYCMMRGKEIDVRAYEGTSRGHVLATLTPLVEDVVRGAMETLRHAADLYEERAILPEVAGISSETHREIAAVARAGFRDLTSRLDPLVRPRDADADELREACRTALRRVFRALVALDAAIADAHGAYSTLNVGDELADALTTRRHYARIRRAIFGFGVPERVVTAHRALERVHLEMVLLIHSDTYALLRLPDRRKLDALSERVDAAIHAGPDAPGQELASKRLVQDLVSFAGLIAQVSRREVLQKHDASVLREALETLATATEVPESLRERLEALEGLDDEADVLLATNDFSADAWRWCVARLHHGADRPGAGRFFAMRSVGGCG